MFHGPHKLSYSDSDYILYWKTGDEGGMGGFGGDADAHTYVSFTINLYPVRASKVRSSILHIPSALV